jgi:signal transduction histidine kinase
MRSLFAKLTVLSLVVIALALVGVRQIGGFVQRNATRRGGTFGRFPNRRAGPYMQLDDARAAYETGGAKKLEAYLQRLHRYTQEGDEHYLVDSNGKDLIDGTDRNALLNQAKTPPSEFFRSADDPIVFQQTSDDDKYHFIGAIKRPVPFTDTLPYYLLILAVVVIFGYILTVYIASPLGTLRKAVDRFGHGDLAARVNSRRKDEFGTLADSFDQMAERMETLMTAERRLLQDISHELRSPLARLSFCVELARTAEDREAAVARIKKEVDRLSSLVGGLLQVTRAEGDLTQREMEDVNLRELLTELTEDCSIEAEKRMCDVVLDAPKPVILRGDRELLRRAIENVLRNAIRYAPEGTSIEVKLDPNPEVAEISIRDYGDGVPEDLLTEIFKPFFRVGQARDAASGGVGLGLAIAQRAVALHQGKMQARNMSPGLLVSVELPLHVAA